MRNIKGLLTICAATLLAAACATTDYDRFDTWDMDNDARISVAEFNEGYTTLGVDLDANNDGFYDVHEFSTGVYDWYDMDNDGYWDRNEYIAANTAFGNDMGVFTDYDLDTDARITNDEFMDRFHRTTYYDTWDVNRGGTLDDFEMRTGMFGIADLDGDGYLDDDEWEMWNTF